MTLFNFAIVLVKKLFTISIFFFCSLSVYAQVTDDSTKNVYGPKTTLFTTQANILNNINEYQVIDTSITNNHLWEPVELTQYYYQSLGTVGTAMRPVFYQAPDIIGKRSGYSVYDYYRKSQDQFRYFDTKSPYTNLRAVIGGNYRAFIEVDFSRNVNENWNTGFSFRRWTVDKQIGPLLSRGDLNVLTHSYDIFSDYRTPNKKYRVIFNFARTYSKVYETGGIKDTTEVLDVNSLFEYEDADINLRNAESGELTQQFHIYQQYKLNNLIQFYHTFDRTNQMNLFTNTNPSAPTDLNFFDQFLLRSDSTVDFNRYVYFQNEIGFKGDISKVFYRFYIKRKDIRYTGKYLYTVNPFTENYAGGYVRLAPKENWQLQAEAEYELNGNYKLKAKLEIPFLEVSALSMQFASPFMYEQHFGNHDYWSNSFGSEQVQQIGAKLTIGLKDYIQIQPKVDLKVVSNHMYFDSLAMPRQSNGIATMLHPGIQFQSRAGNFHLDGDYVYTFIEGTDANLFRIPDHFLTLNFYFKKDILNKLELKVGIDAHYKSTYFADAYDPVIQQFYLQNNFEVPGYMFADIYASARINTAQIFFKYRHLNQGLTADGYITTPYYSGQQGVFDLGVSWSFFD